jgi:exonuclease III
VIPIPIPADLEAFLTPLRAAGDELLVMGDLNECLGANTSGMNAVVAKLGLVDTTSYHHGLDGEVSTYSRSNNRLDCILCTNALAPSIWRCGVLPFNFVISSDHQGAFIDVDVDEFLGAIPRRSCPRPFEVSEAKILNPALNMSRQWNGI